MLIHSRKAYVNIIIYLIFILSVFVDMYNGYCQHYTNTTPLIPSLYKGILLLLCTLSFFSGKIAKETYPLIIIVFLYLISGAIWMLNIPSSKLNDEIVFFIKFFYPYFVLGFLLKSKEYVEIDNFIRILTYYGIIAAASIIVLFYLGLGVNSYGELDNAFGFGTKGFFTAGNDIGLMLLITSCLLCYLYIESHRVIYLISLCITIIGAIMLGTMAGIGGSCAIIISLFIYIVFFPNNGFNLFYKIISIFIGFVSLLFLYHTISDILLGDDYMYGRLEKILEGKSRESLALAASKTFKNFSIIDWCFGMGYVGFSTGVASEMNNIGYRLTEMDFHDVIGFYGFFLGGSIIMYSFYNLYMSVKLYIKRKSPLYFFCTLILLLYIGHGYMAGHAYTSPQSSLLYIGTIFIILKKK